MEKKSSLDLKTVKWDEYMYKKGLFIYVCSFVVGVLIIKRLVNLFCSSHLTDSNPCMRTFYI